MLIDWFTVAAQVVNFLILVWLLKRFLYHPILAALDAREKKIAKLLADADAKNAEAIKEQEDYQRKNDEFEQQRTTLLKQATAEAKAEKLRLQDEARQAAEVLLAKRQETLRIDAHNLNQALSRRARQEVFAIARKTLHDLAASELEERITAVFILRLHDLGEQAKKPLLDALKNSAAPALLRSAFDLSEAQRSALQNALNVTFAAEIKLRFETAPDLISGIEFSTNGQKVTWNIEDYLASVGKGVDELLQDRSNALPESKAMPDAEQAGHQGKMQ
jgi:F-type H+-transporting ATPase subunit b